MKKISQIIVLLAFVLISTSAMAVPANKELCYMSCKRLGKDRGLCFTFLYKQLRKPYGYFGKRSWDGHDLILEISSFRLF
jgi:hypothetical protein